MLALRHSTGLSHVVWRASEELLREEGITTHTQFAPQLDFLREQGVQFRDVWRSSQQGQSHAEGDSSTDESSSSGDGSSSGGSEEGSGGRVAVKEAGLDFLADPEGQKTGWVALALVLVVRVCVNRQTLWPDLRHCEAIGPSWYDIV